MNYYFIVFESESKKSSVVRATENDMDTSDGLLSEIKQIESERCCDIFIHNWKKLAPPRDAD